MKQSLATNALNKAQINILSLKINPIEQISRIHQRNNGFSRLYKTKQPEIFRKHEYLIYGLLNNRIWTGKEIDC